MVSMHIRKFRGALPVECRFSVGTGSELAISRRSIAVQHPIIFEKPYVRFCVSGNGIVIRKICTRQTRREEIVVREH